MAGITDCCVKGFNWGGNPEGKETKIGETASYVSGDNEDVAIMVIHDLFGYAFPNLRLLTDHYAKEVDATAYLPDFFGGETLDAERIAKGPGPAWAGLDIPGFISRNNKSTRRDEIFECAKALRSQYKKVGVIGFCFGGWAVFQLGAKGNSLVDCISTAHPSWLTKEEIDNVGVPVQILAPEHDEAYTQELKDHSNRVIPTLGVPYDYQFFPGIEHSFATRGNLDDEIEMKAMKRAKDAAVSWFRLWLHG
ncbi:putative hydrolase [Xylariales sp. AK1849]|nr:putative hydrolase [Xylariales sp. AK1849]